MNMINEQKSMEQTASNEMSNLPLNTEDNSDSWDNVPETSGNTVSDDLPSYQESSTGTVNFDLDELINMIKNNNFEKLNESDIDEFKNNLFIYKLIFQDESYIENKFPYVYKNKNKFGFFKTLLTKFEIKDKDIETELENSQTLEMVFRLVRQVIKIDKGQHLLKLMPYKKILQTLISNDEYSIPLYFGSGVSSTLPVFIEIDNLFPNKSCLDVASKSILSAACRNSDVRVLKYIVNNFHDYHKPSWNNEKFIRNIISQIFSYHIPSKHSLRRMKIISSKINMVPYFKFMVDIVPSIETLLILKKYYCTENFTAENNNIISVLNLIFNTQWASDISPALVSQGLSVFPSKNDKADLLLNIFVRSKTFFGINILDYIDSKYHGLEGHVRHIVDNIFHEYYEDEDHKVIYNTNDLKQLFKLQKPDISRFMKARYIKKLLFMMPFVDYYPTTPPSNFNIYNFTKIACQLNFIKYTIKIWLRRNHKVLKLENRLKKAKLLNEIVNFKPNEKIPILSKGSSVYQLSRQNFTKLPPRHILPLEIENLKETSDGLYLVREKADGCLVDFISKDVEPIIKEYNNNCIKAEFIEELDLYLIFDIKLDGYSLIERYNYLRDLHPFTRDSKNLVCIETFDQLKEEIKKERKRFAEFLKLPYKNYRVYPKATWLVKNLKSPVNKEITNNIIEENDFKFICEEGEYLNDGLIISPLNGSRELKIKPKSMHTLDLLFNGRNWVDRENISWNHIVESNSMFTANTIWRCYPTFKEKNGYYIFEPKEYRFDKSKPNKNTIVNMIYKLHLINWKKISHVGERYFYHKSIHSKRSNIWDDIKLCQNNHLVNILDRIDPVLKSKWLDLGCGSSKLLKYIKIYKPQKYIGLDFDIHQLLKGVNRIDSSQYLLNNSKVIPSDLKNIWDSHPLAWDYFDKREKYDYIVSNFSMSHFHSDIFWEQLNDVSTEGTIFMFNVVNENVKTEWRKGNDYLILKNDEVKYKFESIHNHEMTEKYVTDNELSKYFKKFNWEIKEKIIPTGNNLDSRYTWYIIKHN